MKCPACGNKDTTAYSTRKSIKASLTRRYRKCPKCKVNFVTLEVVFDKTGRWITEGVQ